jgi:very-short-patch-repair endonuclease
MRFSRACNRVESDEEKGVQKEEKPKEPPKTPELLGHKFRRQHQFGKYVADFYCHEAGLVIECDGKVHQANDQRHHDQNRDAFMIAEGLRVPRFTNDQILNDLESVLEEIRRHLVCLVK